MPILVSALERHGHLQLVPDVLAGLLTMSAATMDEALREARGMTPGRPRRHSPTLGGDPAQRRGTDLWRLERSAARVRGGGSGCA